MLNNHSYKYDLLYGLIQSKSFSGGAGSALQIPENQKMYSLLFRVQSGSCLR